MLAASLLAAVTIHAQWPGEGVGWYSPRFAEPGSFDGAFNFCRVAYRSLRGGFRGGGWSTDYPRADIHLTIRLSELTKTRVSRTTDGLINHLVVRLTDDELFQCPFVLMSEVGASYFDETDAAQLRAYLLKGGFLWVDDFWGSRAWDHWESELGKVLPRHEFPIVDVPAGHPMLRTLFHVPGVPQIPSIQFWRGSGGETSERYDDSAQPHARAVFDANGRMLALMTHNTDVSDSWERETDDPEYFYRFSVDGYAVGIDVLLYAMTH
jgi:hypothetical protein